MSVEVFKTSPLYYYQQLTKAELKHPELVQAQAVEGMEIILSPKALVHLTGVDLAAPLSLALGILAVLWVFKLVLLLV